MASIKISELNQFPGSPVSEDFLPLVDSSSLTTYRANIATLGEWLEIYGNVSVASSSLWASSSFSSLYSTMSTYAISASWASMSLVSYSASWASASVSASYSETASYAWTASHAFMAKSASYSLLAKTASFATIADNVALLGDAYTIPFWDPIYTSTNGDLKPSGSMRVTASWASRSYDDLLDVQSYRDFYGQRNILHLNAPDEVNREDYWFEDRTHHPSGLIPTGNYGGLYSTYPIASSTFNGIEQKYWVYETGSTFLPEVISYDSGFRAVKTHYLSSSGDWYPFSATSDGLYNVFNDRWIRLIAVDKYVDIPASRRSWGTSSMAELGIFGDIMISVTTDINGTNAFHYIHLQVHAGGFSGGITANVLHNNVYNKQVIKQIRIGQSRVPANPIAADCVDPHVYLDILVGNLSTYEPKITVQARSFGPGGSVRFLKHPNFGPPDPVQLTSSLGFTHFYDTLLQFAPSPGVYGKKFITEPITTYPDNQLTGQEYVISGKKVEISPNHSHFTSSTPHCDLTVSGSIGGNAFYVMTGNSVTNPVSWSRGLTQNITIGGFTLHFTGGLLISVS